MQFLKIAKDLTLSSLSNIVGSRNVDSVLNANILERCVNVGEAFYSRATNDNNVDYQKKLNILNQFVGDSDIFEKAALGSTADWSSLASYGCFSDALKIPEDVTLPSSEGVLGNGEPIIDSIYQKCVDSLLTTEEHIIDPSIFSEYSSSFSTGGYGITSSKFGNSSDTPFQWFALPWGRICLYSSLSDEMLYFPVYPEGFDDGVSANYDEMSEMLYQYEPWKVYKSSGPREITFTFNFHRDMWTGDHRDGNANALIRGCEANCYPEYDGSLVHTSLVTLYINGKNFITGVMTNCKVKWDKPIGLDGFYLMCELSFTIVEVSQQALSYTTIKNKGLIS